MIMKQTLCKIVKCYISCKTQQVRSLIQIAGRSNFPGAKGKGFPKYLAGPRENLPYIISAKDFNIDYRSTPEICAGAINNVYKDLLYKHGLLLLKEFPIGELDKFIIFLNNLKGIQRMGYDKGTGARHELHEQVYAASDYSKEMVVEPHNEMSPNVTHPRIVTFACAQPADVGGESVLVDSVAWHDQIDRNITDEFERKGGLKYHLYLREKAEAFTGKPLGADISWRYVYQTDKREDVEQELEANNFKYIWHEDNALQYWYNKPATIKHPDTGSTVWFNQATIHHASFYNNAYPDTWGKSGIPPDRCPFHVYYADGSDIPLDVLQHIRNAAWNVAVGFQLQKNEVLLIDNERFAHARLSYTGNRQLFAALLNDSEV